MGWSLSDVTKNGMGLAGGVVDPSKEGQSLADDVGVGSGTGPVGETGKMVVGGAGSQGLFGPGQPQGGGFAPTPYGAPDLYYGGYEGGAADWSQIGLGGMGAAKRQGNFANTEMSRFRGPQAIEDQWLSDNEAMSRGWDQAGSVQLAREAAMGQAPSEAQWLMHQGMNDAMASQEGMRNSGRGAAGIALANQNASGNVANLQQQAYTQGSALRASEMANARNLYGGLAGQMRQQDQNRLQMGNQMGQFNAGLNDQYKLGMGQLANQFNQQGLGWYQASLQPQQAQLVADAQSQSIGAASYDQNQGLQAGMDQARKDAQQRAKDRMWALLGTGVGIAGNMASGGMYGAAVGGARAASGSGQQPAPSSPPPAPSGNQGRYNPYDPGY